MSYTAVIIRAENNKTYFKSAGNIKPNVSTTSSFLGRRQRLKMPASGTETAEAKSERDGVLWLALKEHIMRERQKKKEG